MLMFFPVLNGVKKRSFIFQLLEVELFFNAKNFLLFCVNIGVNVVAVKFNTDNGVNIFLVLKKVDFFFNYQKSDVVKIKKIIISKIAP